MAGRRGRIKNEPSNINPALLPRPAFAVVPRTPAPAHVPTSTLGGSNEVLNASLVGRNTVPGPRDDDDPLSDPESSLYDYQVMEEAGYSSVDMLAISRKRRSGTGPGRENDVDEMQLAQAAEALESAQIHQNPEALYSMPLKRGQKAGPSQSLRTTMEVRDAMQQVHDLSSDDDMKEGGRGPRQRATSARSLHFPVETETTLKEKAIRSSASTPNQSRKSTRDIEARLVQEIIDPVQVERQQHMPTSLEEPITGRSRTQSARSVSMADDRIRDLEAEREHLTTITSHLENEVQTYREVVSTYESGDSETAHSLLTKKQINDLKEENESLKNSIKRLNVELSAYQAKYRPVNVNQGDMRGMPADGPPPSWLDDPHNEHPIIREFNIRYLNPLFLAYDDRIREREEVIKKCQAELETLRLRTETVVKENEKLHAKLGTSSPGPIDNMEWEQMKDNARLVLEENQNLLEQISVKDQKTHDLHQAHLKEVGKLTKQMVVLKSEKEELDKQLEEFQRLHKELKQTHDKLVLDTQGLITQEQHIKIITEFKQKLSDFEESHRQEIDTLNNKLHGSQLERKSLAGQVIELTAENKRCQTEAKLMHKSVRRAQQKMMLLQKAIEQSENKEMSVQEYMSSLIKVAEKNAYERDTYEKVAKDHEMETKKALKKLLQGNLTVGKMEEKLKLYKMKAAAKISTVAERLKEQEEMFNSQKKEYEREISHLRSIVREKEDIIQESIIEKRDLEEQMEAVWQSANSENVRLKDQVQKCVHQLRKHPGLSEAMDAQEKVDNLYMSSDDEITQREVIKS